MLELVKPDPPVPDPPDPPDPPVAAGIQTSAELTRSLFVLAAVSPVLLYGAKEMDGSAWFQTVK